MLKLSLLSLAIMLVCMFAFGLRAPSIKAAHVDAATSAAAFMNAR